MRILTSVPGRTIPLNQQYLAVLCLCIPMLILLGVGSAIFWILGKEFPLEKSLHSHFYR